MHSCLYDMPMPLNFRMTDTNALRPPCVVIQHFYVIIHPSNLPPSSIYNHFNVVSISRRIDPLRQSSPFGQLYINCQQVSGIIHSLSIQERGRVESYCEFPFCTSSPSDRKLCIYPSVTFPAQSASPPSISRQPWQQYPAQPELDQQLLQLDRLPVDASVVVPFGISRAAMGSSCIRDCGQRTILNRL